MKLFLTCVLNFSFKSLKARPLVRPSVFKGKRYLIGESPSVSAQNPVMASPRLRLRESIGKHITLSLPWHEGRIWPKGSLVTHRWVAFNRSLCRTRCGVQTLFANSRIGLTYVSYNAAIILMLAFPKALVIKYTILLAFQATRKGLMW